MKGIFIEKICLTNCITVNVTARLQFRKRTEKILLFLHDQTLVYYADGVSGPLANLIEDPCFTV